MQAKDEEEHVEITIENTHNDPVRDEYSVADDIDDDVQVIQNNSEKAYDHATTRIRWKMPGGSDLFPKGLEFMRMNSFDGGSWAQVEKRFDELADRFGILSKSHFGQCIGMAESKEFADQLFNALARPRGITSASLLKDELREFWEQISDESFDVRLETFFDMVDKDGDGQITIEEVKEIILLSASANKLSKIKNYAEEYAALIMEELDPENLGYIEVIAVGIAIGVGVHAGAHLTCDFRRLINATNEDYEPMEPFFGQKQPKNYWWFMKGVEGWTGIIMVVLMAIAFILAQRSLRRNRLNLPRILKRLTGFNAFWYSHHLFVIVYVLLVIHGYYLYLSRKWYKKTVS